ncbi:FdhD protein [Kineosphaera limosa]|uniref:Sulfur carrier protein FdhD n=1 Tax=Kineosphaera limosa NBRC 100340 TaxID=1184609 RepID=K6W7E0_9MICO|nr:formate dehydrogenase accessory sulfurtransferase FdhD [Kineosphaera limosa]NYE02997.1 FdhD protein [Kineosphaera limosa]GAB95110.1 protein FdhD homolog [Kineosphaera limosa NBRC 100340]
MGRITRRTPARRLQVRPDGVLVDTRPDTLAVEEPLEIRVSGEPVVVTMRTPGDDFDLTLGWLHAEGHIRAASDVRTLQHCQDLDEDGRPTFNAVDVTGSPGVNLQVTPRATTATSACGMCGARTIADTRARSRYDLTLDRTPLDPAVLVQLPHLLRERQTGFDRTGGMHAAAIIDVRAPEPIVRAVREDVGRHNAVDKVVGWALRQDALPLFGHVMVVSGRAGYELVQKTVLAGAPAMVSVSATSSLAVELAREAGLTLASFVRDDRLTLYSDPDRVTAPHRDID